MLDDVVNQLLHTPDPAQTVWTSERRLRGLTLPQVVTKLRGTVSGEAAVWLHALEQVS